MGSAPILNAPIEYLDKKKRILILEDDDDILQLLYDALRIYGFEVDAYADPVAQYQSRFVLVVFAYITIVIFPNVRIRASKLSGPSVIRSPQMSHLLTIILVSLSVRVGLKFQTLLMVLSKQEYNDIILNLNA
jgi:hypothetical protein